MLGRLVFSAATCSVSASSTAAYGHKQTVLRASAHRSLQAELVKLDTAQYPNALCNDDTPGSFYFRPAADDAHKKIWVISLEGGAECTNEENCKERLGTPLGSSKSYGGTENMEQLASADPNENPNLHNANAVRIKYCSSDLFLGTMSRSAAAEWGNIRFSGFNIVKATLDHLTKSHNLGNAAKVVLTGESAGGIAVFAHLDALAERLPQAHVVGVPIAGYYWDNTMDFSGQGALGWSKPFGIQNFKEYCGLWSAQLPSRCTSSGEASGKPWVCALPHYSFRTLKSPVFVVEALIDNTQLSFHSRMGNCRANEESKKFCQEFGDQMSNALQQVSSRARSNPSQAGLFAPHCMLHTNVFAHKPLINGKSYVKAFGEWYASTTSSPVSVDDCCWPSVAMNPTCP